jgi:hypothetical protein
MEKWTITRTIEDVFTMCINTGGRGMWTRFVYRVEPDPAIATLDVRLAQDANPVTQKWFADVKRGMMNGHEVSRRRGRELVNLMITVLRIDEHPIDTHAYVCEWYGRQFVSDLAFWNTAAIRENEET